MKSGGVRVERKKTRRRALWPPLRRRHDVAITLPLRRMEDLFGAPDLSPLDPDFDRRDLWRACIEFASRDRRFGGAIPNEELLAMEGNPDQPTTS